MEYILQPIEMSTSSSPDLSVIIPMYNAEKYIRDTLSAVLNQENHGLSIEIIIVDDASSDSSARLVKEFCDPRIQLLTLEQNHGTAYARNTGMKAAKGKWIQFMDSDDRVSQNLFSAFEARLKETAGQGINGFIFSMLYEFPDHQLRRTIKKIRDKRTVGRLYSACNVFFSKDICPAFRADQHFEDICFLIDMMCEHDLKPALIPDAWYVYNKRNSNSKMTNFNAEAYRRAHDYIMSRVSKCDRITKMYVLESFAGILFWKQIPLKLRIAVVSRTLVRLFPYLPFVLFNGIRNDVQNIREHIAL